MTRPGPLKTDLHVPARMTLQSSPGSRQCEKLKVTISGLHAVADRLHHYGRCDAPSGQPVLCVNRARPMSCHESLQNRGNPFG